MVENFEHKKPSENPEVWKRFLEIEKQLILHAKEKKYEWIDRHAETFRKYCDEHPREVLDLFEKDPEELYARLQDKIDAEDEGD